MHFPVIKIGIFLVNYHLNLISCEFSYPVFRFFFSGIFFPILIARFFFNLEITYCYILKFCVYIYSSLLLKCILIYNREMSSNQEYLFFSFITSGFSHICNKALCHPTTMFIQTNTIKIFKVSFRVYKVHILKCLVLLEFNLMYNV